MYLLDTNICIYLIKRHPIHVVEKLKSIAPIHIKISSVTLGELEYGVFKSLQREQNRIALLNFASAFEIIPFNDDDAEHYGQIRAFLEKRGKPIGPYDLQIGAQALSRNLKLVTNNVKEFDRIPGLKIENWIQPGSLK